MAGPRGIFPRDARPPPTTGRAPDPIRHDAVLALAFVIQTVSTPPPPRPVVTIPRLEASVTVDGRLDEPAWQQAERLAGFHQYRPVDGRPAEERTEVLIWYSPTAIHFGVLAYDRRPDAIRATVADRDNLGADDRVTIYLDTFDDRRRAFFFGVNPLGSQEDGVRSEGQLSAGELFAGSLDRNPDYYFESKGRITDAGYEVEIRIPFKSLRFSSASRQRWGLNIVRSVQRTGYEDTWTDVRRANASFLGQAGAIEGLYDLQRGLVTEVQPFVTTSVNGRRDEGTGRFERGDLDGSPGVNVRLSLATASLDATLNPDFSQVESDAGLVTLNERFALFFPEKRPFFLEGIELFSTPNQLVYTRQVADPIAGAKVTGKFGKIGVAHLTAVDEAPGGDALFNITRLRRDLGDNSIAGVTFTDRSQGGEYNRVLSGDAHIVFGGLYFVEGQLGASWTRDGAGTRSDPVWKAEFDRTGRSWGFNYRLVGLGPDFVTRAGFVPRTNVVNGSAFNRLSFYGGRGALVENFTTFFGPTRVWAYGDFGSSSAIEGAERASFNATLRGGWQVSSDVERRFVSFDPAAYADYTVAAPGGPTPFIPADELSDQFGIELSAATPTFQQGDASVSLAYGTVAIFDEAAKGTETRVRGSVDLRPTGTLRVGVRATMSRITRARDGSEFARTVIPRLQAEYQPTRALFFRVIAEYRSQRRAALRETGTGAPILVAGAPAGATETNGLRMDWLASFEPSPGTVVFLGYGSSLAADRTFGISSLQRTSDGFFMKLAYQFRR